VRTAVDDGLPVEAAYLEVLTPALSEIGGRWEAGSISVVHEHLASEVAAGLVSELAERIRKPPTSGRLAVISCTPGEQHSLAARMLGAVLESDDWEVLQVGAGAPGRDLVDLVDAERPDVLALSATMPGELSAAGELIAGVRGLESPPFVLVGGQAFEDEAAAGRVDADGWAADPLAARRVLSARRP
jgi:methanogenic corrinoid protein MtbC1